MNYANTLIVDTDINRYDYSTNIWASYRIKSHRVENIEQALEKASVYKYHLIVIVADNEQISQAIDSIQLFRELTLAPIVIASPYPIAPQDRIAGFDAGADEVWETPAQIEVAVAKGNAIIRRYLQFNKDIDKQSTIIINKHIILSTSQRLVYVKGNKVDLTRIEFDILTMLIAHPGMVFTYEQIFREVWGVEYEGNAKEVLRNRVCKLRDKLKIDPTLPAYIKTNQGIGYSFAPQYNK